MRQLSIQAATTLLLAAGCSQVPPGDPQSRPATPAGKTDLPNDEFWQREHDTWGYRAIAQRYLDEGYALDAEWSVLADLQWPVAGVETTMLNRYGTPVQNQSTGWGWYFHSGADINRSGDDDSLEVVAPVAGSARAFKWDGGAPDPFYPYSSVVVIHHPESQGLIMLMHVKPAPGLSHTQDTEVAQGQVIGELASPPGVVAEQLQDYHHTHVNFVDAGGMAMVNPLRHLPYQDSVAPEVEELYALDGEAVIQPTLVDGKLDVVVAVKDLDDHSMRNFEATSIAYVIRDDAGNVLAESGRCDLETLIASIAPGVEPPILSLVDFGNAGDQLGVGGWPNNDQGVAHNLYRYALTQLVAQPDGQCQVLADADGFVEVTPEMSRLDVHVELWDPRENHQVFDGSLIR